MKAPSDLQARGRKFWRSITAEYELNTQTLTRLTEACRVLDALEDLAAMYTETRSVGVLQERRQQQLVLDRLLKSLELPEEDEETEAEPAPVTSLRARRAAQSRWRQERASRG